MLEDRQGTTGLENIGRKHLRHIHRNLPTALLYQEIVKNREGQIAHLGPVVTRTGHFTELPETHRYIVDDGHSRKSVLWTPEIQAITPEQFSAMFARLVSYMQNKEAYVQTIYAGRDEAHRVSLRVITETAWHSLLIRNLYTPIHEPGEGSDFIPDFTVAHAPGFISIPDTDGTRTSSFVVLNLAEKLMFIGGTSYAGEIRQAIFTIVSSLLHERGVFALRCASSVGPAGDTALFLGRRGTGKTSLATDRGRKFLGDHGHAWTKDGIVAFEKGCYAKVSGISPDMEPELFECTGTFGTILENVTIDPDTTRVDLNDRALTENTRAAYPASHLPGHVASGKAAHPKNIFLLTKDAFGVLPPIARLDPEQAVYAFLSSYTSVFKEAAAGPTDPKPKFSACFGTCPLAIPPHEYAMRFLELIREHDVKCWLMNTGWVAEPYGQSERVSIALSRALVRAVVSGALDSVAFEQDPVFGYQVPVTCPDVPEQLLNPRIMAKDKNEFEVRANRLAEEFMKDFEKFGEGMPEEVRNRFSRILVLDDMLDVVDLGFSM
ncbi:MAG: phosphoenolpyruvate carboxykinase (ATP) [Thermodesulfobacteriota bacterium]